MGTGLAILRLAVGWTLFYHGAQKLFGWFGGHGLKATGQGMEKMGFVPGLRAAVLAGLAEAGGGVLLALGLGTPIASALIGAVMLVAAIGVHGKNGFGAQKQGWEYPFVLGLAALSVAFTGAGPLSIDAWLGLDRAGALWGFAALVAAVVGASVQLATRRRPAEAVRA